MSKTKPIGVRFNGELLQKMKDLGIKTPQAVLSFLESNYLSQMAKTWEVGQKLEDAARGRGDEEDTSKKKKNSDAAPDPSNKGEYLKWLRQQH